MFLTRLPVARFVRYDPAHLSRSTVYFPLVGMIVGGLCSAVLWLLMQIFPLPRGLPLAVLCSMLASVLITGAFHEDGLADAADGFGGGMAPERVLEIMRDSRIGTYGAVALWFGLTLKFFLLTEISSFGFFYVAGVLMVAHTAARASSLWLIFRCRYVRSESATSKPFAGGVTMPRLLTGFAFALLVSIGLLQWQSVPVLIAFFIAVFGCERYFKSRIGGITGDALGAANQIVELSVYLALAAASNLAIQLPLPPLP